MASVPTAGVRGRAVMIVLGAGALVVAAALLAWQYARPSALAVGSGREAAVTAPAGPPPWTPAQIQDLLGAISSSAAEGLRPSDYKLDALQRAVAEQRTDVAGLAEAAARALAHDYSAGRIRDRHRFNWYIGGDGPTAAALAAGLTQARKDGRLRAWLTGLLPTSADYRALRTALAATPAQDEARRDRIRANMERWRWLPRDFGRGDQLYINLPTYQLDLIRGGQTAASYKAVIGATDMPTPVLSAMVRQVIVNPDWIVPPSIVRKSHLRPGASSRYIFSTRPDGTLRVRQKPGADNALGKVKIEFPNQLAIYFHDTPSRSLFGASARTFSHGCVRVQHIDALAAQIVGNDDRLATAMAGSNTRGFPVTRPLRANIVYLTLVPAAGGGLTDVGDPYKMDEALAAALDGRKAAAAAMVARPASRAAVKPRSTPPPPVGDDAEQSNVEAAPSTPAPEPAANPQDDTAPPLTNVS